MSEKRNKSDLLPLWRSLLSTGSHRINVTNVIGYCHLGMHLNKHILVKEKSARGEITNLTNLSPAIVVVE